jgi:hypothetical protein
MKDEQKDRMRNRQRMPISDYENLSLIRQALCISYISNIHYTSIYQQPQTWHEAHQNCSTVDTD